MNNSARSLVFFLALIAIAFAAAPARAESALSVSDFSFLAQSGEEGAKKRQPPSLFGGFEGGDRSYAGIRLSWINPDGHFKRVPMEQNFGTGVGVVIYGGRELRRGFAIQFSVGLDSYEHNPGDMASFWSTLGARLQPIDWTFSPYIFGGAGLAAIAADSPAAGVKPADWDGDVDGELAFTTDAGGGVEILLLDDMAFAIEFRYRYQNGFSGNISTHQYGIGGNIVFVDF